MFNFKRISFIAVFLSASALVMSQAWSQQTELERAKVMREEAKTLRDQAERIYATEMPECYQRFLVNHCLDKVKAARLERVRQARSLDIEAGRIELADKQRRAIEQGREVADRPDDRSIPAPAPAVIGEHGDEFEQRAEEVRRQREAEAVRAEAEAAQVRSQQDAERAASRAETEQAAAERAAKAKQDRARYEERLRKAEERLREKAAGD